MPEELQKYFDDEICWETKASYWCCISPILTFFIMRVLSEFSYRQVGFVSVWIFLLSIPCAIAFAFGFSLSGIRKKGGKNRIIAGIPLLLSSAVIILAIALMIYIWRHYVRYWKEVFLIRDLFLNALSRITFDGVVAAK
jgi:hypothetical protein